jgi:hypothetical protein
MHATGGWPGASTQRGVNCPQTVPPPVFPAVSARWHLIFAAGKQSAANQ